MTADAIALPVGLESVGAPRREARSSLVWYWIALLFSAGLAFVSLFALAGTRWYMAHAYNYGLRVVGYSQWIGQRECQVVLYGDSSALTGLDPAVVQARTGLKTCNLSEGTVVLEVTGSDAPLNGYLRHNAPPRYLLGMWTPSMFRPEQPAFAKYHHEGMVYGLTYMGRKEMFLALLHHPRWSFRFLSDTLDGLYKAAGERLRGKQQVDVRAQRIAHGGQWMFPLPPETGCVRGDAHQTRAATTRWQQSVEAFRHEYTTPGTTVLVDVAPVPDCNELYDEYARTNAGLHDNPFVHLPIRYFNQGDVHFSPEGSRYISEKAAEQILALMSQSRVMQTNASLPGRN